MLLAYQINNPFNKFFGQSVYPYIEKDIVIDVFALTLHVDLGTVGQ